MIKRLRKWKLFQQLALFLAVVVLLAMTVLMVGATLYLDDKAHKNAQRLQAEINQSITIYIDSTSDRLVSLAMSYSKWDAMVDATHRKDEQWIKDNATDYLVNNDVYLIDFVYFKDIKHNYSGMSGIDDAGMKELISGYLTMKYNYEQRDTMKLLLTYEKKHYVVVVTPLMRSDETYRCGYFVVGYQIDNGISDIINSQFRKDADVSIDFYNNYSSNFLLAELNNSDSIFSVQLNNIYYTNELKEVFRFLLVVLSSLVFIIVLITRVYLRKLSSIFSTIQKKIITTCRTSGM